MKKIFFMAITLLGISLGSANAQIVWGVRAGLSRPTITFTGPGAKEIENLEALFGLEAGPTLYYPLKNNFYINSGAMISLKSFKTVYDYGNETYGGDYFEDKTLFCYLDIPLYAGYRFTVENFSLYAQAGPYVGVKIADSATAMGPFNAGLGAMAGINLNKFKVEAGYQAGLVNIIDNKYKKVYEEEGIEKVTMGSLFIGVSYIF